jgi:hypothetical protein
MASDREPIVEEVVADAINGDVVRLRSTSDGRPICPVCGCVWSSGAEHAWDKTGSTIEGGLPVVGPSGGICPCCKTEFGNDDAPDPGETLEMSWAVLRERWLQKTGRNAAALEQVREHLGLDLE